MPRKPRFKLAGMPVHVVQRGNNRQEVFYDEQDHRAYLRWLKEGAQRYGCAIHAYVLMTNHVHLLMTPEHEGAIGSCCNTSGGIMYSTSTIAMGAVARCGKGATRQA